MSTAGCFAFASYAFVYTRFAREAYRQKLSEDAVQDSSSGPARGDERSSSVTGFVFDFRCSAEPIRPEAEKAAVHCPRPDAAIPAIRSCPPTDGLTAIRGMSASGLFR
jgi:hypothetical protein